MSSELKGGRGKMKGERERGASPSGPSCRASFFLRLDLSHGEGTVFDIKRSIEVFDQRGSATCEAVSPRMSWDLKDSLVPPDTVIVSDGHGMLESA